MSDQQRPLALGLQSSIWRIFGAVPGPLLFGALFDLSCIVWQEECGRRGHCWVYDNTKLSVYATSVAFPCVSVGGLFFILAVVVFPRNNKIGMDSSSTSSIIDEEDIGEEYYEETSDVDEDYDHDDNNEEGHAVEYYDEQHNL